jgi:hypothetical protein
MTKDNLFDNSSSNNIQKFFSDNVIGSVHMSQYKDPNDDTSSCNSKDMQDLNNDLILATLQQAYKMNQGHIEDKSNENLGQDDEILLPTVDNIKVLLDHTKCARTQLELNGEPAGNDPFKTFLSANDNPLNTNKRILISQKRTAPPPILKKFQAHHPDSQHTNNDKPVTKDHNGDKTYANVTPSVPKLTNNLDKIVPQESTETNEVTLPNVSDQRTIVRDVTTDTIHKPPTEDNDNVTNYLFNEHTIHGPSWIPNPGADTIPPTLTTQVTPNNRVTKRVVNPYAKNPHSDIELPQTLKLLTTNERDNTTPLTGHHQTSNTAYPTLVSLLPTPINLDKNNNNINPSTYTQEVATSLQPLYYNKNIQSTNNNLQETKNIVNFNTKNDFISPLSHQTKQAASSSNRHINLTSDLEPLRTVILSQHIALENHIKDLGSTCLNFTTVIEQKKESALKLHTDKRIPRSLRIKCELSTSPSYENNPDFIILKRELQEALNTFTSIGMNIMKKWSIVNIKLLTQDRCHNIMQRAIILLDGLYTYWKNILEPIKWPPEIETNPILFLIKIYFNENFNADIEKIINYFELSSSEILISSAKIITKNINHSFNEQLLDSINLNIVDELSEIQTHLVTETLKAFDQILIACTISLWELNRHNARHSEATQLLKAKMDAEKTSSATVATALALNKALGNIETNNTQEKATQLRISNLEKHLIQQTQTNKEILNHLKNNKDTHRQRRNTLQGLSHSLSNDIVDLTNNGPFSPEKHPTPTKKKIKHNIQWDSTIKHVQQYNPETTPKQLFAPSTTLSHAMSASGQTLQNFGQPTNFLGNTSSFLHQLPSIIHQTPSTILHSSPGQLQPNINHTHTPFYHNQTFSGQPLTLNPYHNMGLTSLPPNPFTNQTNHIIKKSRGERHRGRRRGFSQRN